MSVVALLSGFGVVRLPIEMLMLVERAPFIFPLHMVASAGALVLLVPTILYRNVPHLHRALGRVVGGFVVVGGLTAIPVALLSDFGFWARAGFFVQGIVWLGLLVYGWHAIRSNRRVQHAQAMLAMAAVTTGAVWFRLIIGCALYLQWPFEATYAIAAWVGWITPLCAVYLSTRDLPARAIQRA